MLNRFKLAIGNAFRSRNRCRCIFFNLSASYRSLGFAGGQIKNWSHFCVYYAYLLQRYVGAIWYWILPSGPDKPRWRRTTRIRLNCYCLHLPPLRLLEPFGCFWKKQSVIACYPGCSTGFNHLSYGEGYFQAGSEAQRWYLTCFIPTSILYNWLAYGMAILLESSTHLHSSCLCADVYLVKEYDWTAALLRY